MRCVLGLFEGVVTGAADGYARMKSKPRARSFISARAWEMGLLICTMPVGPSTDRQPCRPTPSYHIALDTPLTSDIEGIARPYS